MFLYIAIVKHLYEKWAAEKAKGMKSKQAQKKILKIPPTLEGKGDKGIRNRMRARIKHHLEERRKAIRTHMGMTGAFFKAYQDRDVQPVYNPQTHRLIATLKAAEVYEVCVWTNFAIIVINMYLYN